MAYWWCLNHQRVEGDEGCAHQFRLGPYETADEASHALEKAKERNRDWDAQDDEYNRRGQ